MEEKEAEGNPRRQWRPLLILLEEKGLPSNKDSNIFPQEWGQGNVMGQKEKAQHSPALRG